MRIALHSCKVSIKPQLNTKTTCMYGAAFWYALPLLFVVNLGCASYELSIALFARTLVTSRFTVTGLLNFNRIHRPLSFCHPESVIAGRILCCVRCSSCGGFFSLVQAGLRGEAARLARAWMVHLSILHRRFYGCCRIRRKNWPFEL